MFKFFSHLCAGVVVLLFWVGCGSELFVCVAFCLRVHKFLEFLRRSSHVKIFFSLVRGGSCALVLDWLWQRTFSVCRFLFTDA